MEIMEYIRPELLLIVPVLWVLGKLLKEASFVKDKYIPLLLGGVGIVLSVCYIAGSGAAVTAAGIFTAVTQGILCAGVAVYGHQLVKQAGCVLDRRGACHIHARAAQQRNQVGRAAA